MNFLKTAEITVIKCYLLIQDIFTSSNAYMSCIQKEITIPQVLVSPDTKLSERVSARCVLYYRREQVNAIDDYFSLSNSVLKRSLWICFKNTQMQSQVIELECF